MTTLQRGIVLGVVHCLLVLSIAGKYALDRDSLPRVWARSAPFDPSLPIRGRYVSLRLEVVFPGGPPRQSTPVTLTAENGMLTARPSSTSSGPTVMPNREGWVLAEPVAYFLPEHAPDPSRVKPGEELWVEVTVPRAGPPRPVRLGIKREGSLMPLYVH